MNKALYYYQLLIDLDAILGNHIPKYPFTLNEQAIYTQHQIKLYQSNYCHTESQTTQEQPSITGGATVKVILFNE